MFRWVRGIGSAPAVATKDGVMKVNIPGHMIQLRQTKRFLRDRIGEHRYWRRRVSLADLKMT